MLNTAINIACCLEEERRPAATAHCRPASPEETIAWIRSTGGSRIHLFSRCWRDVQFISIAFGRLARIEMPPVTSYSVVECNAVGKKVILPGNTVALSGKEGDEVQLVWIDAAIVRELALDTGIDLGDAVEIRDGADERDAACEHLMRVLALMAKLRSSAVHEPFAQSIARALAAWVLEKLGHCDKEVSARGALNVRAFTRVRAYMHANLSERVTLSDLARIAEVSRFHFARQFRIRTGESPMGYLLRARIERAKDVLRNDNSATVADIAATLGFADQSHFTRTFRRLVGTSPTDYRRPALIRSA
jgi:AraC family transcriptional regulator